VPVGTQDAVTLAVKDSSVLLARLVAAPEPPAALRAEVASRLHRWAPLEHSRLQREGALPVEPVPSRRQHRDWTPAGTERLAARVAFDEVLALLDAPPEPALDKVNTALRLGPSRRATRRSSRAASRCP
jgi:uncharacterized protein (DUF1778 family)